MKTHAKQAGFFLCGLMVGLGSGIILARHYYNSVPVLIARCDIPINSVIKESDPPRFAVKYVLADSVPTDCLVNPEEAWNKGTSRTILAGQICRASDFWSITAEIPGHPGCSAITLRVAKSELANLAVNDYVDVICTQPDPNDGTKTMRVILGYLHVLAINICEPGSITLAVKRGQAKRLWEAKEKGPVSVVASEK